MMHLVHCNDVFKMTSLVWVLKSLTDVILSTQTLFHFIFSNKTKQPEANQNTRNKWLKFNSWWFYVKYFYFEPWNELIWVLNLLPLLTYWLRLNWYLIRSIFQIMNDPTLWSFFQNIFCPLTDFALVIAILWCKWYFPYRNIRWT